MAFALPSSFTCTYCKTLNTKALLLPMQLLLGGGIASANW